MKKSLKKVVLTVFTLMTSAVAWADVALPEAAWVWDGAGGTPGFMLDSGERIYTAEGVIVSLDNFNAQQFTYSFWGKLHSVGWLDLTGLSTETYGFKLERKNQTDKLALYPGVGNVNSGLPIIVAENFILSETKLEFITVVNNAGTFSFYKNGEPFMENGAPLTRTTTVWTDLIEGTNEIFYVGLGCSVTKDGAAERPCASDFADVRLYASAFTPEQVKVLYADYGVRAERVHYGRTLSGGEADWSEADAWTDLADSTQTVDAPAEMESVILTADADSSVMVNAETSLLKLTLAGDGQITFRGENRLNAGFTAIDTDVDISAIHASLGAATIAEDKTLTIGNNITLYSLSGGNLVIDATQGNVSYSENSGLLSGIRDAIKTVTLKGSATTGSTLQFPYTSTAPLSSQLVYESGVHTFCYGRSAGDGYGVFAVGKGDDDPTIRIKSGATLKFAMRDLSGWRGDVSENPAVIRVENGGRLNWIFGTSGTGLFRDRLILDNGAVVENVNADFILHGGASTDPAKAQIVMLDSATPATAEFAGVIYMRTGYTHQVGTRNASVAVGENATLTFSGSIERASGEILRKLGAGTLVLNSVEGGLNLVIDEGVVSKTSIANWPNRIMIAEGATLELTPTVDMTLPSNVIGEGTIKLASNQVYQFTGTLPKCVELAQGTFDFGTTRFLQTELKLSEDEAANATLAITLTAEDVAAGSVEICQVPYADGADTLPDGLTVVITPEEGVEDALTDWSLRVVGGHLIYALPAVSHQWVAGATDWAAGVPDFKQGDSIVFGETEANTSITFPQGLVAGEITITGDYTFPNLGTPLSADRITVEAGAKLNLGVLQQAKYLRLTASNVNSGEHFALAELILTKDGDPVTWPLGTTIYQLNADGTRTEPDWSATGNESVNALIDMVYLDSDNGRVYTNPETGETGEYPNESYIINRNKWWPLNQANAYAVITLGEEISFDGYRLMTADHHPRSPKDWTLEISNDGETWYVADQQVNHAIPTTNAFYVYDSETGSTVFPCKGTHGIDASVTVQGELTGEATIAGDVIIAEGGAIVVDGEQYLTIEGELSGAVKFVVPAGTILAPLVKIDAENIKNTPMIVDADGSASSYEFKLIDGIYYAHDTTAPTVVLSEDMKMSELVWTNGVGGEVLTLPLAKPYPHTLYATAPVTVTADTDMTVKTLVIDAGEEITFEGAGVITAETTIVKADLDVSNASVALGDVSIDAGKILTVTYNTESQPYTSLDAPEGALRVANDISIAAIPEFATGVGTWIVGEGTTTTLPGGLRNDANVLLKVEGTLDVNGTYDAIFKGVTLADGGVWTNTGTPPNNVHEKKQYANVTLEGGTATISGNSFGSIALGYAAQTMYLNGGTLDIAMNSGHTFYIVSANILKSAAEPTAEAGTLQVSSGAVKFFSDKNTEPFAETTTLRMVDGRAIFADRNYTMGTLVGTGGVVEVVHKTLTVGALNTDSTYAGTVAGSGAIAKEGSGTLTLSGNNTDADVTLRVYGGQVVLANNYAGPVIVDAGAELVIDTDFVFSNKLSGAGTIRFKGELLDLGTADFSEFTGTYEFEDGTVLRIPAGTENKFEYLEGVTIEVVVEADLAYTITASDETITRIVSQDGTLLSDTGSYTPGLSGKGAWYEFLFEGTTNATRLANTGSIGGVIRGEKNCIWAFSDMGVTPARQALLFHNSYPWSEQVPVFENYDNWSVSCFAKMPMLEGGVLLGLGMTLSSNSEVLALIRGRGENKVLLVSGTHRTCSGNTYNILADFTVPHAETAYHLYTVVRKPDGVDVYLDGELWVTSEQVPAVKSGLQIGSILEGHLGCFSYSGELSDYFGLTLTRGGSSMATSGALDMLRIYRRALTPEDVQALAAEYTYQSPVASYTRTIDSVATWVEESSWTNPADATTLAGPPEGNVTLEAVGENLAMTMNLTEDRHFESLTLQGDGVTLVGDSASKVARVEGLTQVLCDATIDCSAVEMCGPVRVADGATLTLTVPDTLLERLLDGKVIGTYRRYLTGTVEGTVEVPEVTYDGWEITVEQDDTNSWVLLAARKSWYVEITADNTVTWKAGNSPEVAVPVAAEALPATSINAPISITTHGNAAIVLPAGRTDNVTVFGTGRVFLTEASGADAAITTLTIRETSMAVLPDADIAVSSRIIEDTAFIGFTDPAQDGMVISSRLTGNFGIAIVSGTMNLAGANGDYGGTLLVDEGATLYNGSLHSIPFGIGQMVNNGQVIINSGYLPPISGAGNLTINNAVTLATPITVTGTVTVSAGAVATMVHAIHSHFAAYPLEISGCSLTVLGTLDATAGSVTIAGGKSLASSGTIIGSIILDDGAILDTSLGGIVVSGGVTLPDSGVIMVTNVTEEGVPVLTYTGAAPENPETLFIAEGYFATASTDAGVTSITFRKVTDRNFFTYTVEDGEVTLTDCRADCPAEVLIPSTVDGLRVTSIAAGAFADCTGLTSLELPATITSIGANAFSGCTGLTSVTVPPSVTFIGSGAFAGCTNLYRDENGVQYESADKVVLIDAPTTLSGEFVVPNSVRFITEEAFSGCAALTRVTIPETVLSIGEGAFGFCTNLKIEVASANTGYASQDGALFNKELTRLMRAPGATVGYAIPESVQVIEPYAFSGCSALIMVAIPAGATEIGEGTFADCSALTMLALPEGMTEISHGLFAGCSGLATVAIPSTVTAIGEYAFAECAALTAITIPASVTEIGASAFEGCTTLATVAFLGTPPETVGEGAIPTTQGTYLYEFISDWRAAMVDGKWNNLTMSCANPPSFTVSLTAVGGGEVSGAGAYKFEEEVTVTAIVPEGYVFCGWGTEPSILTTSYTFVMPDEPVALTAYFALQSVIEHHITAHKLMTKEDAIQAALDADEVFTADEMKEMGFGAPVVEVGADEIEISISLQTAESLDAWQAMALDGATLEVDQEAGMVRVRVPKGDKKSAFYKFVVPTEQTK